MTTVDGLPAHILLVHLVVVMIPATALAVLLVALWPTARRAAVPVAVLAILTAILVPVTTEAGEWLEHRVASTPLIRAHTELGDYLLPWVIALAAVALALATRQLLATRARRTGAAVAAGTGPGTARTAAAAPGGRALTMVLAIVALVVAGGSTATVYRIGESGARAAWTGQFSDQAQPQTLAPRPGG
jgi:hypothetical protein